jgi:hypothetical protein
MHIHVTWVAAIGLTALQASKIAFASRNSQQAPARREFSCDRKPLQADLLKHRRWCRTIRP